MLNFTRHIEVQIPISPLEVAQMVFRMEESEQEVFFNEISKQSNSLHHALGFQIEGLPDHMYLSAEQVGILIGSHRDTVISRTNEVKTSRYYLQSIRATKSAPIKIQVKWLKDYLKRITKGYLPSNEQ